MGKEICDINEFERCYCNYGNINESCIIWADRLESDSCGIGFDKLVKMWKPIEIVEAFWTLFAGREAEIAEKLVDSETLRIHKSDVKTIGIFYIRMARDGAARVISLLIPMYLSMGYSVILITDDEATPEDYVIPSCVKRYIIPSIREVNRTHDYISRGRTLCDILTKEKIDVLCYHAAFSELLFFDLLTVKLSNVKFVLEKHEMFSQGMVRVENRMIYDMNVYPLADALVVLSETEQLYWRTLGVNAHFILNPAHEMSVNRSKTTKKKIVWVGRLDRYQKRYQDIVPIIGYVVKEVKDVEVDIYGSSWTFEDSTLLESQIEESGLQHHIKYRGYTTDINEIYGDAMIHLVTSAYESFGMNILESKSCGIPLVTYDMPYLELLRDKLGCIIVPQKDYKAAARAIITLLNDSKLLEKYSEEALYHSKQFRNETLKGKWKNVFETTESNSYKDAANDMYSIILRTMIYHYSLGFERLEKESRELNVLQENKRINEIKIKLLENNWSVAIYPFGDIGRRTKKLLNDNNIREKFIIDNKLAENDGSFLSIKDLEHIDCTKLLFVICSDKVRIYDEIRKPLYEYVNIENIYDLYPRES